jgi:hypothetical protein
MPSLKTCRKPADIIGLLPILKSSDSNGEIVGYFGTRKSVPEDIVVKFIEPLYKKLLHIEEASGMLASEEYLIGFLEERKKNIYGIY